MVCATTSRQRMMIATICNTFANPCNHLVTFPLVFAPLWHICSLAQPRPAQAKANGGPLLRRLVFGAFARSRNRAPPKQNPIPAPRAKIANSGNAMREVIAQKCDLASGIPQPDDNWLRPLARSIGVTSFLGIDSCLLLTKSALSFSGTRPFQNSFGNSHSQLSPPWSQARYTISSRAYSSAISVPTTFQASGSPPHS